MLYFVCESGARAHDLCNFLDISVDSWSKWTHNREDLSEVIACVEQVIFQNKFEGAVAGFFNANIIARDLGLADKQEHKHAPPRTLSDFYNMAAE